MKFIKNTFRILTLALFAAVAVPALAQTPTYRSFIADQGFVLLPFAPATQTSSNYSSSLAYFYNNYTTTNGFYWIKSYVQTNSSTTYSNYPYTSAWSPVWTQGNPFSDVPLWANRDGTVPNAAFNLIASLPEQVSGSGTNTILVTLTTLNRFNTTGGSGFPSQASFYNNNGQNTWSFVATNTAAGTNILGYDTIAISTNIPTGFLTGALGLQVKFTTYYTGTNSASWTNVTGSYSSPSTNVVQGWQIQSAGISGFQPNQP